MSSVFRLLQPFWDCGHICGWCIYSRLISDNILRDTEICLDSDVQSCPTWNFLCYCIHGRAWQLSKEDISCEKPLSLCCCCLWLLIVLVVVPSALITVAWNWGLEQQIIWTLDGTRIVNNFHRYLQSCNQTSVISRMAIVQCSLKR